MLDPVAEALAGAALAAGDPARMADGEQYVVLPPEIADLLRRWDLDLDAVQRRLFDRGTALLAERAPGARVAHASSGVIPLVSGGPGVKMAYLPGWIGGSRAVTRRV